MQDELTTRPAIADSTTVAQSLRFDSALHGVALAACAGAFGYFLMYFDESRWQPSVDLAWALSGVCWAVAFWRRDTPSLPRLRHPWWAYAVYAAILLPFATNWRWSMAGDNLSWPYGGLWMAEHGPTRSLLSANGADNFGYLQMTLHDTFMLIVSPTIFWHRVGKIAIGVLAFAAVFTVFARLVTPAFALLVAACSSACSVWIVYTYASVPFMDGIASGYALLAIGLWIERDPHSRRAWLILGLLSGFMLFLTPNGWFMALCVWSWLGVLTLLRRWPIAYPILAVVTTLIVGCPMLIQWSHGGGGQLFGLVGNPGWTVAKVLRFLSEAAFIPFASEVDNSGAFGPQLPWGFRWLFVAGVLITPWFPRRFPAARFVLCLLLIHVVILAFTQSSYAGVSVKRALVLIPMATYFAFLPFHSVLRSYAVVLPIIAVWASLGAYDIFAHMKPGRTGYTLLDGVVEADQRFHDAAAVCVYLRRDGRAAAFAPGSELDRLYGLAPHTRPVTELGDPACEVLCYCPQPLDPADSQATQTDRDSRTVNLSALGYTEVPMLDSVELRCGRKRP
jgi:hypothetical protein